MEQLWMTVARTLNVVRVPLCLAAALLGLILLGMSLARRRRESRPHDSSPSEGPEPQRLGSSLVERLAVGICAAIALAGITAIVVQAIRRPSLWHPVLLVLYVFLGAPALLWRTTWRLSAEASATVMLAALTFITGFSIGFLIVPPLALMMWVCFRHLSAQSETLTTTAGSG